MKRNFKTARRALFAGLFCLAFAGPTLAQQLPNAGLGSAWPTDARDVSLIPGFHAYAWMKSGVKYVQVNDAAGNVLIAVATAGGTFLPLPMGRGATALMTPQDGARASAARRAGVAVYQDETVQVMAVPQANGTMAFSAMSKCTNPVECTTHIN